MLKKRFLSIFLMGVLIIQSGSAMPVAASAFETAAAKEEVSVKTSSLSSNEFPTTKIYATTFAEPGNNRNWREGMVTGNGHNGVVTSGAPYSDALIYQNMYFIMPNGQRDYFDYSVLYNEMLNARTAVINENASAASNALRNSRSYSYAFHPSHQLRLSSDAQTYTDYMRWTDFETAEVGVNYTDMNGDWERRTFTSRADDVTITEIKQSSKGAKVNVTVSIDNPSSMYGFGSFDSGGIRYKKLVADNLDYITQVAHYPNLGTELNRGGFAGLTYVVAVGGTKEKVQLGGTKDSQNVGADTNPGIKVTDADAVYLITKSDRTTNMGNFSDFAGMSGYELVDKLAAETKSVANKYGGREFDYELAIAPHIALHKPQFNAVRFNLDADEADRASSNEDLLAGQRSNKSVMNKALTERAYNAGRYAELTCSGYMTPRLTGMWTGEWNPGWRGIYTLDANVNLQVSPMNTSNMKDTPIGYIYFILRQAKDWLDNAYHTFHMTDAIQAPVNADGDRALQIETDRHYPFQFWHAGASWLLLPIYEYWQCYGNQQIPLSDTVDLYAIRQALGVNNGGLKPEEVDAIMDRGYMDLEEDILLPLLTKQANYWEQLCTPEYYMDSSGIPHYQTGKAQLAEDERYCLIPTYSPENNPRGYTSTITLNATMDISAARDGLNMTIEMEKAVKRANYQNAVAKWEDLMNKLPEYQFDGEPGSALTSTGGGGALREWATQSYTENNNHRHISHLYLAWPGYETRNDPALNIAAKQALDNRDRLNTGDSTTGHGYMHRALVAARLNDSETVENTLRTILGSDIYYNSMMTDHNTNRGSDTYCTDTSIGYVGVINESLVFSNTGEIEILPALPASWDTGSMDGLMARTRAEVEKLSWDQAKGTASVQIRSDADQTITLTSAMPWKQAAVSDSSKAVITPGEQVILNLKKDDVITVRFYDDEVTRELLKQYIDDARGLLDSKTPSHVLYDAQVNSNFSNAINAAQTVYNSNTTDIDTLRISLESLMEAVEIFEKAYDLTFDINLKSGIYSSKRSIGITKNESNKIEVRYTLDGSEPTASSIRYQEPVEILEGVTYMRAGLFAKDTGERIGDILEGRYFYKSGLNLAKGKTASSPHPVWTDQGAERAIDGNSSTRWAVMGAFPEYVLEVNLGVPTDINTVLIDEYTEAADQETSRLQTYSLYYNDGGSWKLAHAFGENNLGNQDVMARDDPSNISSHAKYAAQFEKVKTDKVRLVMTAAAEISLWSFELYNVEYGSVSTSSLQEAMAKAEQLRQADYKPSAWEKLQGAYLSAMQILSLENKSQQLVNLALKELNEKMAELKGYDFTVSITGNYVYSGKEIIPNVIVRNGEEVVSKDDYRLAYQDNVNAGEAMVVVTGLKDYKKVLKKANFTIGTCPITACSVDPIGSTVFTGKDITPAVTVKNGAVALVSGRDFTVSYKNNRSVGTAAVTITGIGNYSGSKQATFAITPAPPSKPASFKVNKLAGGKNKNLVKLTWKKVSDADGYEIYRATSKKGKYKKIATIKKRNTLKYKDTKRKANKKYFYYICAYKKVDKTTLRSAFTKKVKK